MCNNNILARKRKKVEHDHRYARSPERDKDNDKDQSSQPWEDAEKEQEKKSPKELTLPPAPGPGQQPSFPRLKTSCPEQEHALDLSIARPPPRPPASSTDQKNQPVQQLSGFSRRPLPELVQNLLSPAIQQRAAAFSFQVAGGLFVFGLTKDPSEIVFLPAKES